MASSGQAPGQTMDLSNQGLRQLVLPSDAHPVTLILDKNELKRIENLEGKQDLKQLSIASNRIVSMSGVLHLANLTVLNLPNNDLSAIEGTRNLTKLTWLNLSANRIRSIENLMRTINLRHLDLSDNQITALTDLSHLKSLRTLLLHGNRLVTLRRMPQYLPASITILSLAENLIDDLTDMSNLAHLKKLEQLSVKNNPCVEALPECQFNYRPYLVNWCPNLKLLDGAPVSEPEALKAEWLYSQGRARHFVAGQHAELTAYLRQHCPPRDASQESDLLAKVLNKRRLHRQEVSASRASAASAAAADDMDAGSVRSSSSTLNRTLSFGVEGVGGGAGGSGQYQPLRHSNLRPSTAPDQQQRLPVAKQQQQQQQQQQPPASSQATAGSRRVVRLPPRATLGYETHSSDSDTVTRDEELNSSMLHSESVYVPVAGTNGSNSRILASVQPMQSAQSHHQGPPGSPAAPMSALVQPQQQQQQRQRHQNQPPNLSSGNSADLALKPPSPSVDGPHFASPRNAKPAAGNPTTQFGPDALLNKGLHAAAVRIQSAWRGYRARHLNPRIRLLRERLYRRRVQQHLAFLHRQLEAYHESYQQERRCRLLQVEAIRCLLAEVEQLKSWQPAVNASLQRLDERSDRADNEINRLRELFRRRRFDGEDSGQDDVDAVTAGVGGASETVDTATVVTDLLSSVKHPGCPLPPTMVTVASVVGDGGGVRSIEVKWQPSDGLVTSQGTLKPDGVTGYAVYINGAEKARVYDSKCSCSIPLPTTLLTTPSAPISVAVAAVSDLGESCLSNPPARFRIDGLQQLPGARPIQDVTTDEDVDDEDPISSRSSDAYERADVEDVAAAAARMLSLTPADGSDAEVSVVGGVGLVGEVTEFLDIPSSNATSFAN